MTHTRFISALALFLLLGCATLPSKVNSEKAAPIKWSECVTSLPPGPEKPNLSYPRFQDYPWMGRDEWCKRVKDIQADPARKTAQLAFMGDSITQMWPRKEWTQFFGSHLPIKMGIGGDRTQNLLWRIQNGELRGLSLKTMVLLIGTNNLGAGDTPPEALKGIQHVIAAIRQEQPQARIILMAIFPREQSPKDPLRLKVQATNELLIAKAKDWNVDVLDIGAQLVEEDGSISKEMMGDFVHLTAKGYQIWAGAVIAALNETKSSEL